MNTQVWFLPVNRRADKMGRPSPGVQATNWPGLAQRQILGGSLCGGSLAMRFQGQLVLHCPRHPSRDTLSSTTESSGRLLQRWAET